MANITLDIVSYNFGIQEYTPFNAQTQEIFKGCPEMRDGYFWVNERPGWGIEMDEKLAAKFPIKDDPPFDMHWGNTRRRDGTIVNP